MAPVDALCDAGSETVSLASAQRGPRRGQRCQRRVCQCDRRCTHASVTTILRRFGRHERRRGFPLVLTAHDASKVLRAHGVDTDSECAVRLGTTSRFHAGFPWRCCVMTTRGRQRRLPVGRLRVAARALGSVVTEPETAVDAARESIMGQMRGAQDALFRDYLPDSAVVDPCWGGPCVHMQAAQAAMLERPTRQTDAPL